VSDKAEEGRAALDLMIQGFNASTKATMTLAEQVQNLTEHVAAQIEANRVLMEHMRALQEQIGVLTNVVSVSSGMGPAIPLQQQSDPLGNFGQHLLNGVFGRRGR
jgi:hypothetical protein